VPRSRSVKGSVLAIAAVFVMSACGAHPGAAAVVGDERISDHRVDDVASALCAAQTGAGQSGQQPQDLASRAARQGALDVLLSSTLSRQYGESQGVEPDQEQVARALAANEQNLAALPPGHREVFKDVLRDYAEGQLMLIEIGRRKLTQDGKKNIQEQQAVAEGTKLRNAWAAKNVDIDVDPRFGEYSKNTLLAKSGSLSVASSARAADGSSPDPSQGWVAALPTSQKCH
jgi:SurA-like protein